MRRRDKLAAHLMNKNVLEDVFKSIAWVVLSGAIFKYALTNGRNGDFLQALALYFSFCVLFSFVIMYACLHIIQPMSKSMEFEQGYIESRLSNLSGYRRIKEKIKIFLIKPFVFYVIATVTYFVLGDGLANIIAKQLS